jgi:hypothetical protein
MHARRESVRCRCRCCQADKNDSPGGRAEFPLGTGCETRSLFVADLGWIAPNNVPVRRTILMTPLIVCKIACLFRPWDECLEGMEGFHNQARNLIVHASQYH